MLGPRTRFGVVWMPRCTFRNLTFCCVSVSNFQNPRAGVAFQVLERVLSMDTFQHSGVSGRYRDGYFPLKASACPSDVDWKLKGQIEP